MKKLFILSALAVSAMAMTAKTTDDIRVYINPGHGSWTGNDRPQQTIGYEPYSSTNTDTTAFFESNTNLIKGFGVLETLIRMGVPFDRTLNQTGERWEIGAAKDLSQQLVMSRVKNGPYEAVNTTSSDNYMKYNRSLLEIATEVETNDFDIFISIHSNAAGEGSSTNYHLFMYRGKNGKQNVSVEGSWEMIEAAAKYSFPNKHACWSASNVYINGDVDFMGSGKGSTNELGYFGYLGVLKHGTPGYLVEGYFHTYQPARHRGMNFDVDFEEGSAYARGVAEYFGFDRDKTGDVYGIVRDLHEKFTHSLYHARPNSDDVFKPLNGCKVILQKDGKTVGEYTTDQNYNGAWVFTGLEPGKYTVTYTHPDYKDIEPQEVEVVAGDCVYPKAYLENKEWVAPTDLKETYPDQLNDKTAFGAAGEYNFTQTYVDEAIPQLAGKKIRRTVVRGDKLYVLAHDADWKATIVVYDLAAKKVLAEPSTTGMKGSIMDCADIQVTADGILVASSKSKLHYSAEQASADNEERGTVRFYRWENTPEGVPTGDPVNFISTQNSSLWYRTYGGGTFCYYGTLEEGTITMANPSVSGPNYSLRTLEITVADGAAAAEGIHKPMLAGANITVPGIGADYLFIPSPLNGREVWILSSKKGILETSNATGESNTNVQTVSAAPLPDNCAGMSAFKYSGHSYLAAPALTADRHAGVVLYDVTAGIDKARNVVTKGTVIAEADTAGAYGTSGWVNVVRNKDTNAITDASIELTAVRNGAVSRFTTAGTAQPSVPAVYAYALTKKTEGEVTTLSFKASGKAPAANVVLVPTDSQYDKIVLPVGEVNPEGNSINVNLADLPENASYNWSVEINNDDVPYSGIAFTAESNLKNNSRGGLVWINDTESANFGKTVVSNGFAQGVDIYDPGFTLVGRYKPEGNRWVNKINSPYRAGQSGGIAYLTDWSDGGAGYWVIDPSNPTVTHDIMGGTVDSKGAHTVDGTVIGGGSTCVAFQGTGADKRMYSFVEDYPAGNSKLGLYRYNVGEAESWVKAPETSFANIHADNLMSGTNVEVVTLADGFFVSQVRSAGRNLETSPGFIYADNDGKVLFNSSVLGDDLPSCGSGIAISPDLKVMAISEAKTGIGIWDVTWNEGVPSFTKRYILPGSTGNDEVNQLAFDVAGNLYAYHRSNFGMRAYSIRSKAPVAVTAAPKSQTVGHSSGVEDITASGDVDAPVHYYNLQGVEMPADNLAPGIYIRRQGRVSKKVIIR